MVGTPLGVMKGLTDDSPEGIQDRSLCGQGRALREGIEGKAGKGIEGKALKGNLKLSRATFVDRAGIEGKGIEGKALKGNGL